MRKRLILATFLLGGIVAGNANNGDMFGYNYEGEWYDFRVISEEEATVEVSMLEPYYPEYYINATIKLPDYAIDSETDKKYKVIRIGDGLLKGYDRIGGVVIPSTVTEIGKHAFYGCKELKTVDFGESIVKIEEGAFFSCGALDMLCLPETLVEIGKSAFSGCTSLTAIIIPDSVTKLGEGAFVDCYSVKPVVIGNSVTQIDDSAFTWFMPNGHSRSTTIIYDDIYVFPNKPPKRIDYECVSYVGKGNAYCRESSIDKYNQSPWWGNGNGHFLSLPDVLMIFYKDKYIVSEGESVTLVNNLFNPGNVEIVSTEWEAFNDKAVSVKDGIAIGLKSGEMTTITCRIKDIAGEEYEAQCKVEVVGKTGIDSVEDDSHLADGVYTVNGIRVADSTEGLASGVYIVKNGNDVSKLIIK